MKKFFILITILISYPLVSFAYHWPESDHWYTFWLKSIVGKPSIYFIGIFFLFLIFLLGILSLFFRGRKWSTFKTLLKGLMVVFVVLNIAWFVVANILSHKNPRLNGIYPEQYSYQNNIPQVYKPVKVNSEDLKGTPSSDNTPRIMYWPGKVNQHMNVEKSEWETDSGGLNSDAGTTFDKLDYCKKMYSDIVGIRDYKMETISTWRDRGNLGEYTSTKQSYECIKD